MTNNEIQQLEKVILKAGISAFEKHYKMTDGEWVFYTPEYWYTCQIGEKINKSFPKYSISLENSIEEVRKRSKPKAGKPSKRLKSGRTDITLWKYWKNKNEYDVKTLIEVKRGWSWITKTMGDDIDRLRAALLQTKGIKDAFFVVITDEEDKGTKTAKEIILGRLKNIKNAIENHLAIKNHPIQVYESIQLSKLYKDDQSRAAVLLYRLRYDGRKDRK